jgi:co-chaperonin GroES (HSP10)
MAKLNFQPTRDWVVLPLQRKDQTDAGILLTGGAENSLRTNILKVLAAGPKCEVVKEGDTVMVHPSTEGLIVEIDNTPCVMVNEFSICGILPE